jgi:hypothetical protein
MKKLLLPFVLTLSIWTRAQTDALQRSDEPLVTAIGTPHGRQVEKEIGPAGGSIVSGDGKVELVFPAGALAKGTTISIQPTTNPIPKRRGLAYRFEPSGIQFQKPVQLVFHYTEEEAENCPPDLMNIALQDHTGKWDMLEYEAIDSNERKLTGFIRHFSYFTNFAALALIPNKDTIPVNATADIAVEDLNIAVDTGAYVGQFELAALPDKQRVGWFVNEIPNGNSWVGQMTTLTSPISRHRKIMMGTYLAPDHLPSP